MAGVEWRGRELVPAAAYRHSGAEGRGHNGSGRGGSSGGGDGGSCEVLSGAVRRGTTLLRDETVSRWAQDTCLAGKKDHDDISDGQDRIRTCEMCKT